MIKKRWMNSKKKLKMKKRKQNYRKNSDDLFLERKITMKQLKKNVILLQVKLGH